MPGTAPGGGPTGFGTVFSFNPSTQTLKTLHGFSGDPDGMGPYSGLVIDSHGMLYGTTPQGGEGWGTVFEVDSFTGKEKILHSFTHQVDGEIPKGGLALGKGGLIYGTTVGEGGDCGTVFQLEPKKAMLKTVHTLSCGSDGQYAYGGLTVDKSGAVYGTTTQAGANGGGTIFKYEPFTEMFTALYSFNLASDGGGPYGGVVFDDSGAMYGTASSGGVNGDGTVFKFDQNTQLYTVLHAFTLGRDGADPNDTPVLGTKGTVYRTAVTGGVCKNYNFCGTLFKVTQ
jgi:uncharacterized repeat protein (TIGR03803 family)